MTKRGRRRLSSLFFYSGGNHGVLAVSGVLGGCMANIHRVARLCFFFLFGVALIGAVEFAHAESKLATSSSGWICGGEMSTLSSSGEAACKKLPWAPRSFISYVGSTCTWGWSQMDASCQPYGNVLSCESGWTLDGLNCTRPDCATGQTRQSDGTCATSCTAGVTAGDSTTQISFSGQSTGLTSCLNSCAITSAGGCIASHTASGWTSYCKGPFTKTGASCTATTTQGTVNDPAYECAKKGMGSGTVNGAVICVPADSTQTVEKQKVDVNEVKKDAAGVPIGNAVSSEDSEKNTTCTGTACTTTIKKTVTNPDGTKDETTTTKSQDKSSFCTENPTATICKNGTYTDSGCTAAPACDGDAIQCAQATQAWKIKCDMETEPTDAAYTLGKGIAEGGTDPHGNPLDPANATNVDIGNIVSTAAGQRTLTGTCIASPSMTVLGKTFTFDTTLFCQFSSIVGYMMVAASSIIAVRMVTSGA